MKPICVPCRRFFRPERNGVFFVEGMPKHNDALPGNEEPQSWRPYKLWCGDKWACPGCGATIIVGVAHTPISEHYKPDFHQQVKIRDASELQINDC